MQCSEESGVPLACYDAATVAPGGKRRPLANDAFNSYNDYDLNFRHESQLVTGDAGTILSGRVALKPTPVRLLLAPYVLVGARVSRISMGNLTKTWSNDDCPVGFCSGSSLPSASHVTAFAFIGGGVDISLGARATAFGEARCGSCTP